MADKDINIHIRAKDTEQANQKIKGTAQSIDQLGSKVESSSQKSSRATEKLSESTNKSVSSIGGLNKEFTSFIANTASIAAAYKIVTDAVNAQTRALEENANAALSQQNSVLRLQFLGDFFQEKPELRKEVAAMAEFGRRPFEEVAGAWYNLRSKNSSLPAAQQESILKEALEMGRTDPDMPLETLVDMFSLYAKKTGTADANQAQNVLQQTITEAGGSGSDAASYMPRFLPIGMAGGLTGAESAGLWAYATTQSGEASIATTGLKALFLGLQGKGTPESEKMLKQFGISGEGNFFDKIQSLSAAKASGQFGLGQAEQLAGREGADILLSILDDPAGLMRTIQSVTGVDRGDIDITKKKIEGLFGSDAVAETEEDMRLLGVKIQNVRAIDKRALDLKEILKQHELRRREEGYPEYPLESELKAIETLTGFGLSPEHAYAIGSNIFNDDRKMNLLGAIGPTYKAVEDWDITKEEIADRGNTNIHYHNEVIYNRPEKPATTRTGDLN